MVRLEMWESGEVGRWEVPDLNQVSGTQGEPKVSSFCF